jgi:hypothetical protein
MTFKFGCVNDNPIVFNLLQYGGLISVGLDTGIEQLKDERWQPTNLFRQVAAIMVVGPFEHSMDPIAQIPAVFCCHQINLFFFEHLLPLISNLLRLR